MVRKALVIGINYTGTSSQLCGCINDAENIREYLLKGGYSPSNIIMLTDNQSSNRQPTSANIKMWLAWLTRGNKMGDHYFFHYSGHGTRIRDRSGDELDGFDEAIIPIDYIKAGVITDDYLWKTAIQPLGRGVKITMILDCCHSGSGADLRFKYPETNKIVINPRCPQTYCDSQMISGCKDTQTSADTWIREERNLTLKESQTTPEPVSTTEGSQTTPEPTSANVEITPVIQEEKKLSRKERQKIARQKRREEKEKPPKEEPPKEKPPKEEPPPSGSFQGAMTNAFLSVLEKNNYIISNQGLIDQLRDYLKTNGYTQIPQFSTGNRISMRERFMI